MTSYTLPGDYKDEAEFIAEARKRFTEAQAWDRVNRDEGRADLKFAAGDQWEPEDLAARSGRPCLTINRLPQFIAQIVGDMRINRPSIKVRPAEDADKDLAEVREGIIRGIEQQSDALRVYVEAGQSQVACGIGNFRAVLDYTADDVFDRDIFIRPIANPFAVVWDPLITDATGRDAGYCFVQEDMPRKAYEAKYGDELPDSLGEDAHTEGWFTADTVRVTEYWVVKEREAQIALLQDGSIVELTAKNKLQVTPLIQSNSRGPMVRKAVRKSVCMYLISGTKILEKPVEYKLSRIPIFRVPGWEMDLGQGSQAKVRWGVVRFARDPTRINNYMRSVATEKLALAPRQQWLVHENQSGDQEDFREAALNGETVLTWNGQIPPQRMEPPPIEAALIQESALNAQDMKDVTGLHDASLGARSNETSGKAILARQREGDVASYIYHDNQRAAIAECGRVLNEWIPQVYDTARSVRILGADETQKVIRVNDPGDPDSVDLSKGKYDLVVETGPSYSTRRVEAAESMAQFFTVVPAAAQAAGDLFAKAQDWPLAEEIGERLKKTLPPQLVEDDDNQTPEAMQAKQQAAMQAQQMQALQQAGVQLELSEKAAKVDLTRAQAAKLMSEVGAPQGQPESQLDVALKLEQVRKAKADADKAEADAQRAWIGIEADRIGVASDALDLHAKPAETALSHASQVKTLQSEPQPAA